MSIFLAACLHGPYSNEMNENDELDWLGGKTWTTTLSYALFCAQRPPSAAILALP
jgi:hypothetical protein